MFLFSKRMQNMEYVKYVIEKLKMLELKLKLKY